MDSRRFDDLARSLAGGPNNRTSRRGFLAGLTGLAAGVLGVERAGAVTCPSGQYAGSGSRCLCRTTGRPPDATGCPCGAGQTNCNGVCKDLSSDAANCGGCAAACPAPTPGTCEGGVLCRGGACIKVPAAAGTVCRAATGQCDMAAVCDGVSLACPANGVKPNNTACDDGNACATGDSCQNGVCTAGTPVSCPACQACSGGTCQPVRSDARCATTCCNGVCCGVNQVCVNGVCREACVPLRGMCDLIAWNCCQDQPTDCSFLANSSTQQGETRCCRPLGGVCNVTDDCCDNAECRGGRCRTSTGGQCVAAGECEGLAPGCCDGTCRELADDVNNCGACGRVCPASTSPNAEAGCFLGACVSICADGFDVCNDACVRLSDDEAHCGACGRTCAGNERCCGGVCRNINSDAAHCGACGTVCPDGWTCCFGTCRDLLTDRSNCGGCADLCAIDQICDNGNCRLAMCKANGDACHAASECCSGQCNNICNCSPGGFPTGGSCQSDDACCQGRCVLGSCVCFPPAFPPAPGANGPCFSNRDCCSGSCLLDPTGNIGLCTCKPIGVPCESQFECCSGECNLAPFGDQRFCSPFD